MSDFRCDDGPHRRPHTSPMAAPFLEFDLARELERLSGEPEWSRGQNAKTMVKYGDFRVVLIALKTGASLPEHEREAGCQSKPSPGESWCEGKDGPSICPLGTLIALDHGLPHEVEAIEESACLLTIAWPREGEER